MFLDFRGVDRVARAGQHAVLDIDLTDISIEDMQIIDRMGAPESGTFAAAVDVMAKFVTNIDIRKRPLRELRAITRAVMAQIKEESAGN